jgi:3-hydroxyacyl-[acyl-carrier-protein] dehydratase
MTEWRHVDAIPVLEPGRRATGERLVREGGLLNGHFPGRPILPGVLIIEGFLEVGRDLIATSQRAKGLEPTPSGLLRIEKANFVQAVVPGERLRLDVEITRWEGVEVRLRGTAAVDGTLKAEAIFVMALKPH